MARIMRFIEFSYPPSVECAFTQACLEVPIQRFYMLLTVINSTRFHTGNLIIRLARAHVETRDLHLDVRSKAARGLSRLQGIRLQGVDHPCPNRSSPRLNGSRNQSRPRLGAAHFERPLRRDRPAISPSPNFLALIYFRKTLMRVWWPLPCARNQSAMSAARPSVMAALRPDTGFFGAKSERKILGL